MQQVTELLQQPESWELSRHPKTRPAVESLKADLEQAYHMVRENQKSWSLNARIARAMLCGVDSAMVGGSNPWQQLDEVLKVAYKMRPPSLPCATYMMNRIQSLQTRDDMHSYIQHYIKKSNHRRVFRHITVIKRL